MELPVQIHGLLVPNGPWEGPVVSVYSRAVNVLHPRGVLVAMVATQTQMSPFSLVSEELFSAEGGGVPAARIATGALCRRAGTGLTISGIRLDFAGSRSWDGCLPAPLVGSLSRVHSLLPRLRSALAALGADDGLHGVVTSGPSRAIFERRARRILDSAWSAAGDRSRKLRGLARLVGLGIGFTPSGDDFLSGVVLAREMSGRTGPELDDDALRSALDRTNDGGRTLLTAVISRRFPAYLLEFADSIAAAARGSSSGDADDRRVHDAVRAAVAHGETSGTDAVTGFAWYLGLSAGE